MSGLGVLVLTAAILSLPPSAPPLVSPTALPLVSPVPSLGASPLGATLPSSGSLPSDTLYASFAAQAAVASVGAAAGLGLGLLAAGPHRCPQEDVGCIVPRLFGAGLFPAAGAAAGSVWMARRAGDRPSVVGAAAGAVAGSVLGVGLWKLLEEAGTAQGGGAAAVVVTLPQGILATWVSRVFSRRAGPAEVR